MISTTIFAIIIAALFMMPLYIVILNTRVKKLEEMINESYNRAIETSEKCEKYLKRMDRRLQEEFENRLSKRIPRYLDKLKKKLYNKFLSIFW
jgi:uncharacterized membrane protein (DUF106 family)